MITLINTSARALDRVTRMYGAQNANVLACNWVPVRPSCSEGQPREKRYHIAWLADSFRALIEKSMSICASSSPGRLPARLKSPNEAWSRYLIPDSLSQSDFAAEVIHPSQAWRWALHAACCCAVASQYAFSHAAPPLSGFPWSHHISQNTERFCRDPNDSKCYGLKESKSRWRLSSVG